MLQKRIKKDWDTLNWLFSFQINCAWLFFKDVKTYKFEIWKSVLVVKETQKLYQNYSFVLRMLWKNAMKANLSTFFWKPAPPLEIRRWSEIKFFWSEVAYIL